MNESRYLLQETKDPELIMISEVNLNFDDLEGITYVKRYDGYLFTVNNVEYIFRGWGFNNDTLWRVKFGIHKGNGDLKDVEMTDERDYKTTSQVMSKVCKSFLMFVRQYDPDRIDFDADRPSRQKLYERLFFLLYKKKEFQGYTALGKIHSDTSDSVYYSIKKK